MSELGGASGTLIPGDPQAIRSQARELRELSDRSDEAGFGLRSIELGAWTGEAARQFEDRFAGEPARWFNASDSLALAAEARRRLHDAAASATAALDAQADVAPEKSRWLDAVGNAVLDTGAGVVNAMASFGNSLANHPGDVVELAAGTALMNTGVAGEIGGLLLDVTGIGAPGGVALNVASAGVIATGGAMAAHASLDVAAHASTDDSMTPMRSNRSNSSNNERHGDNGRTAAKNQPEIEKAEAKLQELYRTQGPRKEKQALHNKIRELRLAGERAARGEEHSRGAKR